MKIVTDIILLGMVAVGGFVMGWTFRPIPEATPLESAPLMVDSVTLTDTVVLRHERVVYDTDTVYVPIVRTIFDTVIREVHVAGQVSGFMPSLDSLVVECPPCPPPSARSPWALGVQMGFGMASGGFTPYLGIGLTFNLLSL